MESEIQRHTGTIRQIVIGSEYVKAQKYTITGKPISNGSEPAIIITDIIESTHDEATFGIKTYEVWADVAGKENSNFLWWAWSNQVCGIQYFPPE